MLTPVNILLIIIWALIVPSALGLSVIAVRRDDNISISKALSYGFAIMCAVFQLLAVPMIFMHVHFSVLKITYIIIISVMAAISVLFYIKRNGPKASFDIAIMAREVVSSKMTLFVWILAIIVILFETYLLTFRMHMDTDDARFLADALEAVEKDTMLLHHPITGFFHNVPCGEQLKDITAPYPIFLGLIGCLYNLSPTIAAHTILPILFIPLCYLVYSLIGGFFFDDNVKNTGLFILFLSLIQLFSFETIYSAGYTLLTIVWQGRSVAAVIMLPLLWYELMRIGSLDEVKVCDYISLVIIVVANSMLSNMGSLFAVILSGAYALSLLIRRKEFKRFLLICVCSSPAAIYVIIEKLLVSFDILYK